MFITVRTYWNKVYCRQFAVSRTTTSCLSRTECHACHSPHCRIPMCPVHGTRKLVAEQSRSKSSRLFSVDSVVSDCVTSQNFRHRSAASSHRLLGSAFLSLFVAKLSDIKNSPVFWPTLYIYQVAHKKRPQTLQ